MEVFMTFSERMDKLLDQGKTASMGLAAKAGAKAQDLGERGVLAVEIKQLESKAQKLISRLGAEVYHVFMEQGEETLSKGSDQIKTFLSEISAIKDQIEQKEGEIKTRKTKQAKDDIKKDKKDK